MVEFDWDDANRTHIAAHKISCEEAEQVIANEPIDLFVDIENDEERLAQVGETNGGRILAVVSTWRGSKLRVVTAWDPPKALKTTYLAEKGIMYGGRSKGPKFQG